jgi:CheY-like chemotaxis protein
MGKTREEIKILIVDDNEKALRLLEANLFQLGFRTVIKENRGAEALETARTILPDLIFLDIIMPGMDGGNVKRRLAEDPMTRDIPVVFMSAILSKEEGRRRGGHLASGEIIISNPYSSGDVMKAIELTLGDI